MFQKITSLKKLKGVQEVLCNGNVSEEIGKSGKPYLNLILSDDNDNISIKIWNNDGRYESISKIPINSLLEVKVEYTGVKNGYDQYILHDYKIQTRPSLTDCVEIEGLKDELREIISNEIDNEEIKDLIFDLFKDEKLKELIFSAPLTEKSGYSFKGGLLAHIVRTCRLTLVISDVYDNWKFNKDGFNAKLNKSVLLASAILHDVGVGVTLEIVDDVVRKTYKGNLNESSYYSAKILIDLLKESKILDEKKDYLEHVVTSAKGKLAYGALNTPRSKEAVVFHEIERIDSVMGNFEFMDRVSFGEFAKLGEKQYCLIDFNEI